MTHHNLWISLELLRNSRMWRYSSKYSSPNLKFCLRIFFLRALPPTCFAKTLLFTSSLALTGCGIFSPKRSNHQESSNSPSQAEDPSLPPSLDPDRQKIPIPEIHIQDENQKTLFKRLSETTSMEAFLEEIQNAPAQDLNPILKQSLDLFFNLGAQTSDYVRIIHYLNLPAQFEQIMSVKNHAIQYVIRTTSEYLLIFEEIIPNSFHQYDEYFEQNTVLFLALLPDFILDDKRTKSDFNLLREFLQTDHLHRDYEQSKRELLNHITEVERSLPNKIRRQVVKEYRERLIRLYQEVKPVLTQDSPIRFYLLKTEEEQKQEQEALTIKTGQDPITFDELSETNPGISCPHHAENRPIFTRESLASQVKVKMGEHAYPVKCGSLDEHHHELYVTQELLQGNMNDQYIQTWYLETLRAYHLELLRLNGKLKTNQEPSKICLHPDCGVPLFEADQNDDKHVTCPNCETPKCYECLEEAHKGITCEDARKHKREHIPFDSEARPCPLCLVVIEKDGGCDSMICESCNLEFHMINGIPREFTPFEELHSHSQRDSSHYSDRYKPLPRRRYKVKGDPGYKKGDESAFPEHQGNIRMEFKINR